MFCKTREKWRYQSCALVRRGAVALMFSEEIEDQILLDDKIEKNEMSRIYSTHGEDDELLIRKHEGWELPRRPECGLEDKVKMCLAKIRYECLDSS
jgi:hypothetical protein